MNSNNVGIERRYFKTKDAALEIRSVDDKFILEGYAALFNSKSEEMWGYREIIRKGAFKKTINDGADVRALFNHDPNYILGRTRSQTLKILEDDRGLYYSVDLPNTSYAKDLYEAVKRGDISQNSFSFSTVIDEWNEEDKIRTLVEVKLFDVSPVTYPAYPETELQARTIFNKAGIDYKKLVTVLNKIELKNKLTEDEERDFKKYQETLKNLYRNDSHITPNDHVIDDSLIRLRLRLNKIGVC